MIIDLVCYRVTDTTRATSPTFTQPVTLQDPIARASVDACVAIQARLPGCVWQVLTERKRTDVIATLRSELLDERRSKKRPRARARNQVHSRYPHGAWEREGARPGPVDDRAATEPSIAVIRRGSRRSLEEVSPLCAHAGFDPCTQAEAALLEAAQGSHDRGGRDIDWGWERPWRSARFDLEGIIRCRISGQDTDARHLQPPSRRARRRHRGDGDTSY